MTTKRSPYDFYPTPESAFTAMYEADKKNWKNVKWIIEPCAGDGALISYMKKYFPNAIYTANELDESHKDNLTKIMNSEYDHVIWGDYKELLSKDTINLNPELAITNPPFSLAQEVIEYCLTKIKAKRTIMLLRLNFLASQKRKEFWQKYPPSRIYVLSKRPSFTGTGTDSQDYAWFVWDDEIYDQQIVVV